MGVDLFNLNDFDNWDEGLDMRSYTADFETTTDPNDCRVWAMAVCEIGNEDNIVYGNCIEDFFEWCNEHRNTQLYFHNLAFDGAFIMDWLEKHDWEWIADAKEARMETYTTLISNMNQVYCITLYYGKGFKVRIYDSLKIIPLSIKAIAKAYKLPILKGELDYEAYREVGHELTQVEIDYLRNDVQIAAMALKGHLDSGLTKMTAGSNALYDFKMLMGGTRKFRRAYPEITEDEDSFIRKAYRGGFTYVNPKYAGLDISDGIVFDVNSLYPSVMYSCSGEVLPIGKPLQFFGDYENLPEFDKKRFNLWVCAVTCSFKVKPDHIPCIQLKGNNRFKQTEYIENSNGEVTFMTTSVDWKLINQQYDLENVTFLGGYAFQSNNYMFKDYVDKWIEVKNQATIEGNGGMRQIAKLMLNSLYGKFATRTTVIGRAPELGEDGVIRYVDLPPETRPGVYLPVGVFITAYARYKTITSAQAVYERFIYADTDSLHLIGTDIPDNLHVDAVELGAWKHESTFYKAKFLRAKTYIEYEVGSETPTVHVAGMPASCHSQVDMDNFMFGAEYEGKLYTKRVPGGIVLIPDKMQIRE